MPPRSLTYIYIYIYIYTHTHMHMYVYIYICMYIYTYKCLGPAERGPVKPARAAVLAGLRRGVPPPGIERLKLLIMFKCVVCLLLFVCKHVYIYIYICIHSLYKVYCYLFDYNILRVSCNPCAMMYRQFLMACGHGSWRKRASRALAERLRRLASGKEAHMYTRVREREIL